MQRAAHGPPRRLTHQLIVPEFVNNVVKLNSTAERLRRGLVDCKPALKRCLVETEDATVIESFTAHCEEYDCMLRTSENDAVKLAGLIGFYLAIQNEARARPLVETENTVRALYRLKEASPRLQRKLATLAVYQSPDFAGLGERLQATGERIDCLFDAHIAAAMSEFEGPARAHHVRGSGSHPEDDDSLQTHERDQDVSAGDRWASSSRMPGMQRENVLGIIMRAGPQPTVPHNAPEPQLQEFRLGADWIEWIIRHAIGAFERIVRHVAGAFEQLKQYILGTPNSNERRPGTEDRKSLEAKAWAEMLNRNRRDIRHKLRRVCEDLKTQPELLRAVFSEVTSQLQKQSDEYLDAVRRIDTEGSPVDQLAFPNAKHRFLSTSGAWKERENTLTDEYAKRMK